MLLSIILALDANFVDSMFSDISGIGWICMFASLSVGIYGFVKLFFDTSLINKQKPTERNQPA